MHAPLRTLPTALLFLGILSGCARSEGSPSSPPEPPRAAGLYGPTATKPRANAPSKMAEDEAPAPAPQVAEPPPAPAYDLAADQQRRAQVAKQELGRVVTAVVSDIFVVIGPPGWQGEAFQRSVALMQSAMAGFMNGRFGKKPSEAISVYLFPNSATYEAFCTQKYAAPCIAHYGFYQPGDRYMVMNAGLGLGTLTHEIVHPLVEADFPNAPTWINEGIASVFEAPVIPRAGEIHGVKNWRHPRLKKALTTAERDRARLDGLFVMSDTAFRGEGEDLHYATARYVCQWLDERGKLWAFYHRWRDNASSDPTGEAAFREVVGMTPAEAHVPWSKWVLAL